MQPFAECPAASLAAIRYVLTDIDDTLTYQGRLSAETYLAMERLHEAGLKVIPVTAGSSGWCDLIARMWPVDGVVGENGGLYFRRGDDGGACARRYWSDEMEHSQQMSRLLDMAAAVVSSFPTTRISADQGYRETTLALTATDGRLPGRSERDGIVRMLRAAGACTTINSMWVLGWLGQFDKLTMTRRMIAEVFALDIEAERSAFIYIGDSLNDEPMFRFFPNSVGVATVAQFLDRMSAPPRWITSGPGGAGFSEIAAALLKSA